jgi:diguanylate cyclase (GGDEF)-like protein
MREQGCVDESTGLPNATMMKAHLRELLGTLRELRISFSVICLRISDLSQFRARYGQVAARSILQVLAHTLRNTVWATDFVGRWDEERFLVILNGCREDALQVVSQRIQSMTASATIQWWGEELSVKVELGGTTAVAGDGVESILLRVEQGLRGNDSESPEGAALTVAAAASAAVRKKSTS